MAVATVAACSRAEAPPLKPLKTDLEDRVLRFSVRGPANEAQVRAFIFGEAVQRTFAQASIAAVLVYVYDEGAEPGKDKPSARWEWHPGTSSPVKTY